jgi:predicted small secreted protein
MKIQDPRAILPAVVVAAALLLQGCATVVRGTSQKIPVTSAPSGAKVLVNGKDAGTTPLILKLKRRKPAVIRIESEGFDPYEIRIERKKPSPLDPYGSFGNSLLALPGTLWLGGKFADKFTKKDADDVGEAVGNALWGALAGYGLAALISATPLVLTDSLSGAAFSLAPTSLEVELTRAGEVPRVGSMELDAAKLQDIKWLRVRLARRGEGR